MLPTLDSARPALLGLAGLGLVAAIASRPVLDAAEAWKQIETGRARLARAEAVAVQPPPPLLGADAGVLLAAFRARLDALAAARAVVLDRADIELDPARPNLPRLRAVLRGTAEGLHGLLSALETDAPLVAVEEADLGVERPADPEIGRPTMMRLGFVARGVLLAAEPGRSAL